MIGEPTIAYAILDHSGQSNVHRNDAGAAPDVHYD